MHSYVGRYERARPIFGRYQGSEEAAAEIR